MGRISRTIVVAAAGLAVGLLAIQAFKAYGQTAPDKLIGTAGGGYEAFDPVTAVRAGSEAYLPFDRVGVLEFNGNNDTAFLDTMLRAQAGGQLATGDKWYGANAGLSFNGKIVRFNGTTIPANVQPGDLGMYFETILEGGGGPEIPDPPSTGSFLVESTDGSLAWQALNVVLEEELFAELPGAAALDLFIISNVNQQQKRVTLAVEDARAVVARGIAGSLSDADPQPTGTADAGSATTASRADHVHFSAGGGGGADLSDASPKNIGPTDAGTGGKASRADHVHALDYRTTAPPVSAGTGNPGTAANAARGDHAHPIPPGIATNAAAITAAARQGTTNRDNIQTNAGKISTLETGVSGLETVKNPALASGTAGHLVRQKSDHSAYETVSPHDATLAGLPAITGQGGKCLKVNTAATGYELADCGGGGSGGGGSGWTQFKSVTITDRIGRIDVDWAAGEAAQILSKFKTGVEYSINIHRAVASGDLDYVAHGFAQIPSDATSLFIYAPFVGTSSSSATGGCVISSSGIQCNAPQTQTASRLELWLNEGGGGGGNSGPSIPAPTAAGAGEFLRVNAAGAAYELAAVTPGHPFGVAGDVAALKTGSAAAGSSARVSRADHAHNLPTALYGTPVAVGKANADGSATTLARSDHVHHGASAADLATTDAQVGLNTENIEANTAKIGANTSAVNVFPQVSPYLVGRTVAANVGPHTTYTPIDLDNMPAGRIFMRMQHRGRFGNNLNYLFVYAGWFSKAALLAAPQVANNTSVTAPSEHIRFPRAGVVSGAYVGRGTGNELWFSLPTGVDAQNVTVDVVAESGVPQYFLPVAEPDALLYTATNTATQWATGNVIVSDGVATKIYDAMRDRTTYQFNRLEIEVAYARTVDSQRHISKALIPIPLQRRGGIDNNSVTALAGVGRLGSATIHAHINLPTEGNKTTDSTKMSLGGCTWCQGGEMLAVHVYGVN